jgi:hypothetical protein
LIAVAALSSLALFFVDQRSVRKVNPVMPRARRPRLLVASVAFLVAAATAVLVVSPASAVAGLVVVKTKGPDTGSEDFKWALATCPSGTHVLGGGGDISGGSNGVHLSSLLPSALGFPADSFYVTAMEDHAGYGGSWNLTAWAICASGIIGWEVVTADAAAAPGSTFTSVTAVCPAGKKVIGAGGYISGGSRYIFDSMDPASDLSSVYVEVAGDETTPVDGAGWGAHASAVCINPVVGQRLVSATTGISTSNKTKSVSCPSGTKVHGTGGGLTGALGQAHIDRLAPNGTGSTAGVDIDARQDLTGASSSWQAYVYAICAK